MSRQSIIKARRGKHRKQRGGKAVAAFVPAPAGAPVDVADVPISFEGPEAGQKRAWGMGLSFLIHGGVLGLLFLIAALAPVVEEEILEVQLLRDTPEPEAPRPAPRALAERRNLDYAPAVQAFQPQSVNPRVIQAASPAIKAEALEMDAVSSVAAPTEIATSTTVVERVSAISSPIKAVASKVDVAGSSGPVVRGPVKVNAPIGASVGPRKVTAATGTSSGFGKIDIGGGGSSVREGVISSRDVAGSPDGAPLVSVNTQIGDGLRGGTGGSGSGRGGGGSGGSSGSQTSCYELPEVQQYLAEVEERTLNRWNLPPGVSANQRVTLRFNVDVAGSATKVSLVRADDNALGASAVDALRAASPFPPMPEKARCLARLPITATFSNPGAT